VKTFGSNAMAVELLCDDYVKTHPYRYCREVCAERSFNKESFETCVEECVKRVEKECQ
jgi:hypothetical protein